MSRSELDTDTSIISETNDFLKTSHKSITSKFDEYFEEKSNSVTARYYPLPNDEKYEDFLKKVKSEQYSKTQYSIPYLLSLKKKNSDRPDCLKEIKIPLKHEIRSRAKILTDEAFRDTRNYLNLDSEILDFTNNLKALIVPKPNENLKENNSLILKTKEIREILNKISFDNYNTCKTAILKINYDQFLIENLKDILFSKLVNEKIYFNLYFNLTAEMFKIYNKKTFPNNPEMNFKSLILKKCQEEFYNLENTSLKTNFLYRDLSRSEQLENIKRIKIGNINLIAELYLNNFIQVKITQECVEYLIKNLDEDKSIYLCELTRKIYQRLENDDSITFDKIIGALEGFIYKENNYHRNKKNYFKNQFEESFYIKKGKKFSNKTKHAIQEILDIKTYKKDVIIREFNKLHENENSKMIIRSAPGNKESHEQEYTIIEKDLNESNNKDLNKDYLKKQDQIIENSKLDEILTNLGTDIELYKCFKLDEEQSVKF